MSRPHQSPAAALLVDYGGVLTAPLSGCHRAWSRARGLPPYALDEVLRDWRTRPPPGGDPVLRVEAGQLDPAGFERLLADALNGRFGGRTDGAGLLPSMLDFFSVDQAMVDAVGRVRAAGVPTVLVTNSWGSGRPWEALRVFDAAVISYEVKARKPDAAIYFEAVSRVGVPPRACVFVDDLAVNVEAAVRLGFDGIHHVDTGRTIRDLQRRFPALA